MARVMHIAEIEFRVKDLPGMVKFYKNVLELETVHAEPNYIFLKVGELDSPLGRNGHPQYLVLFDRGVELDIKLSTIDHLAFEIELDQFEAEVARLEGMGLKVILRDWSGHGEFLRARSLFFYDPEGNTLEFIAHDPSVS